jgi:hypothetical protein
MKWPTLTRQRATPPGVTGGHTIQPKPEAADTVPLLRERQQVFCVSLLLWVCLAAWTLSAFWEHINSLDPEYALQSKLGACGGELLALAFIYWHSFHAQLHVRKWALIHSLLLAAVLLVHSGGVRGLKEAKHQQLEAEKRVAAHLGALSAAQTRAAGEAAAKLRAAGGSDREATRLGARIAQEANRTATQQARETVEQGTARVLGATLLPDWYWRDWCYSGIFLAAVVLLSHLCWVMLSAPTAPRKLTPTGEETQPGETKPRLVA